MKLINNFLILPKTSISIYELLINEGKNKNEANSIISSSGISSINYANFHNLSEFIFEGLLNIKQTFNDIFNDVDSIVVVSQTYNQRLPSISTRVQKILNLNKNTYCIDLMDGCTGFIKALSLASMLEKEGYKKTLIISGDLNSKMTEKSDSVTKILFGDGLSVNLLERNNSIIDTQIFNSGDNDNLINCNIKDNTLNMKAFEVFMFARNTVPKMIGSYLKKNNKTLKSYDLLGLHQASKLIVSTICSKLKYTNTLGDDFSCEKIGNIGSGSIGAWLSKIRQLENKGKLNMLAVGFGAGLSWGLASLVIDIKINRTIYI